MNTDFGEISSLLWRFLQNSLYWQCVIVS